MYSFINCILLVAIVKRKYIQKSDRDPKDGGVYFWTY